MDDMNICVASIVSSTSVDGVGLRNALYVAGCHLRCPGCHNSYYWNMSNGTWKTVEEVYDELTQDDFNISILGGEPLLQPVAILHLCKLIKQRTPEKTIWLWTGYTYDEVWRKYPEILDVIDVLVDGPFKQELAEPNLKWKGSTNQRVIDVRNNTIIG